MKNIEVFEELVNTMINEYSIDQSDFCNAYIDIDVEVCDPIDKTQWRVYNNHCRHSAKTLFWGVNNQNLVEDLRQLTNRIICLILLKKDPTAVAEAICNIYRMYRVDLKTIIRMITDKYAKEIQEAFDKHLNYLANN